MLRRLSKRDPLVAAILRAWRQLTIHPTAGRTGPGAPTLVACSGGADSSALLLALGAAKHRIVVGHVLHDMRPAPDAAADRDAVKTLAQALGLEFVEERVKVTAGSTFSDDDARLGNPEAEARRLRYAALARMAMARGIRFVATAHHADDQVETMLMSLVRGAGLRGLSGVAPRRRLIKGGSGVWLIRPMLGVTRADSERLCHAAGWAWREDTTNSDTTRLRSAIRHGVIPQLTRLRPGVPARIARTTALIRDAAGLVDERVGGILAEGRRPGDAATPATSFTWARQRLRAERAIVVGSVLRRAASSLTTGAGLDRLNRRLVDPAVRAVRDRITDPRRFNWGPVEVVVEARTTEVRLRGIHD